MISPEKWDEWTALWRQTAESIEEKGGWIKSFEVQPPATEAELVEVEKAIGQPIPPELREVMSRFSRQVEISWFSKNDDSEENPWGGVWMGDIHWGNGWLIGFESSVKEWIAPFNGEPSYLLDAWSYKIPFMEVGNGDYVAIDVREPGRYPVVYLSHDDNAIYCLKLAESFVDFLDSYTKIGLAGPDFSIMRHFLFNRKGAIDVNCQNAIDWREWLGLKTQ